MAFKDAAHAHHPLFLTADDIVPDAMNLGAMDQQRTCQPPRPIHASNTFSSPEHVVVSSPTVYFVSGTY